MNKIRRVSLPLVFVIFALVSGPQPTVRAQAAQQSASTPAPPPSAPVEPANPAGLDPAALTAKIEEYMQAHVKTNGFSGTILLAREGKPLISNGYGFANVEWEI